jgi:hypothetical protein
MSAPAVNSWIGWIIGLIILIIVVIVLLKVLGYLLGIAPLAFEIENEIVNNSLVSPIK